MRHLKKTHMPAYALPLIFFTAVFVLGDVGIYNDSHQYIAMHIHREPLYSFFLWIFRSLLGENSYLQVVRILQNLLAAGACMAVVHCLDRHFQLNGFSAFVISGLWLSPHLITPLFSATHLVLSNGVMSEALGLPLFYLFICACLNLLFDDDREKPAVFIKKALIALLLALLLSLTRGQLMTAILLWGLVCIGSMLRLCEGKKEIVRRLLTGCVIAVVGIGLAFGARGLVVRSYNLAFNGRFIPNTFGNVGILANIVYAAEPEDADRITDEEARFFYDMTYAMAVENGALGSEAPAGFLNRGAHLEEWHDTIKFKMIEECWRDYHDIYGPFEYITENIESDRVAGILMKSLLPGVWKQWLYNYLALAAYGFIRSIAVIHPLINWYALIAYLALTGLMIAAFCKNVKDPAAWTALFALLCIMANVFATSMVIMCLSRYMIYCLPLFYTAGWLLLCNFWGKLNKN